MVDFAGVIVTCQKQKNLEPPASLNPRIATFEALIFCNINE